MLWGNIHETRTMEYNSNSYIIVAGEPVGCDEEPSFKDDGEFYKDIVLPPSGKKVYLHNLTPAHTQTHTQRQKCQRL